MDIIKLNELIYAGAKLISNKIGRPLRNPNRQAKPGWEMKLEEQMKKLQQQAKILRKVKHTETQWKEKKPQKITADKSDNKTRRNKSKDIVKDGRHKKYWYKMKQYKQNSIFLSLSGFGQLPSSLLLFPRFGQYVFQPSSGVC